MACIDRLGRLLAGPHGFQVGVAIAEALVSLIQKVTNAVKAAKLSKCAELLRYPPAIEESREMHDAYRAEADMALQYIKKHDSAKYEELSDIFVSYLEESVESKESRWGNERFVHQYAPAPTNNPFKNLSNQTKARRQAKYDSSLARALDTSTPKTKKAVAAEAVFRRRYGIRDYSPKNANPPAPQEDDLS